jgi:putative hydrolases of HD superfamily
MLPSDFIQFYAQAEHLKNILRHSYTSANRHESVAEHSWMLCLMALAAVEQVSFKVDLLRLLKMLIVHDLPEAITGDIPVFDKMAIAEAAHVNETEAMAQITALLPETLRQELISLFAEFEAQQTDEAKLANALDKAEAFMQHNLASLETWTEQDFNYQTNLDHPTRKKLEIDPFMVSLGVQIDRITLQRLDAAGLADKASLKMQKAYREGDLNPYTQAPGL